MTLLACTPTASARPQVRWHGATGWSMQLTAAQAPMQAWVWSSAAGLPPPPPAACRLDRLPACACLHRLLLVRPASHSACLRPALPPAPALCQARHAAAAPAARQLAAARPARRPRLQQQPCRAAAEAAAEQQPEQPAAAAAPNKPKLMSAVWEQAVEWQKDGTTLTGTVTEANRSGLKIPLPNKLTAFLPYKLMDPARLDGVQRSAGGPNKPMSELVGTQLSVKVTQVSSVLGAGGPGRGWGLGLGAHGGRATYAAAHEPAAACVAGMRACAPPAAAAWRLPCSHPRCPHSAAGHCAREAPDCEREGGAAGRPGGGLRAG